MNKDRKIQKKLKFKKNYDIINKRSNQRKKYFHEIVWSREEEKNG